MRIIYCIVLLMSLLLFNCSKEKKSLCLDKYPFFSNAVINKENNTISLNNFDHEKNGVEYLLHNNGHLLEYRNWNDGMLNGKAVSYSVNGNVKYLTNYVNDTIIDFFYEVDTINPNSFKYTEKIKNGTDVVENQKVNVVNGKIDLSNSFFYFCKLMYEKKIRIYLLGNKPFSNTKVDVCETHINQYLFKNTINKRAPEMLNNTFFDYEIKNRNSKFLVGELIHYRQMSLSEIAEYKAKKDEIVGRIIDIKFPIQYAVHLSPAGADMKR